MKRKTILMSLMVLSTLLIASSIIATSQAWWPQKHKPEYVGYDSEATFGPLTVTSVDTSGAPVLIIDGIHGNVISYTITIDDNVYSYPEDFDLVSTVHVELSAMTGEGFHRVESTLLFKMPGCPTLNIWVVSRITGYKLLPNGTPLTPQDIKTEAEFKVTGTKKLANVDGFGLGESHTLPPDYTNQQVRHFGFIKGWPC